jgi:translation elongation factor EF-4
MKKPGKTYRGVLKARISKLYGGDVTIAKAKKLKARKTATSRDKQLANWFINMHKNK